MRRQDGKPYHRASLLGFCGAVHRHLRYLNRDFDLFGDPEFARANNILDGHLKQLKQEGKLKQTAHKPPIADADLEKLKLHFQELGASSPIDLTEQVWFWLTYHLSLCGRRQELPLSGGNGNPTSGYEAKERCAADHATRPTAHRSRADHTSISAAPDDLRSRSGHAHVHSCSALSQCLHASISVLTSRCFIVCFVVFESVCACMCVDCIDVCFEPDRLPAKKDFTR